MTRTLNLDARRKAAVDEGRGEPLVLTLEGKKFTLPAELPLAFGWYLQNGEVLAAAKCLVGEKHADSFLQANPSIADMEAIVEAYGVDLGEASASPTTLTSTGTRSKATGRGTTKRATKATSARRTSKKVSAVSKP